MPKDIKDSAKSLLSEIVDGIGNFYDFVREFHQRKQIETLAREMRVHNPAYNPEDCFHHASEFYKNVRERNA